MVQKQQQVKQQTDVLEASEQVATDCEQVSDKCDIVIAKIKTKRRKK